MGYLSEANELQPGLVPSHCYLPSTQKVTVSQYENGKVEKISRQKWLIRLQMVQFE